ncbi:hypothetical protein C8J98_107233 [Luteibacter sp. OK325]|jgi:hypothetical protein|uniref:hypothetical protein n=1 Tax=Luteibacter sp. OK325 TaxID=2135670 RepID=UPI000D35310D|nr:hypothetical protein [Luteibacter sp. OK325]PTR30097.1 hypothetical protein C8J98_107233 [Luteibacter sp. OK325]
MDANVLMEVRVTALETEMKFVRRDLDEVRTDVRTIQERISSIDVTLGAISEKLDRFPTKLQLTLWACAGLAALLGVSTSMFALVLRLLGHNDAAAVVDAVGGR